ncbi:MULTISPECIES: hypothetical protein [unclassified Caulobacter]|jgi:hypothetical protein|uniref:hypothetical protein n=1 Tax=unclassified Caulobacter TaxID=2648921 RepID=UPI0006FE1641|nr:MULTISPECIES: hypothetical protein [unclassified Caulobacter]KQV54708.1 hypothetical protein ASC62_23260 [Caulobacter sp. Root342]KQV64152.1 hypothetical protein ASC70_20235 [Caulobacter sp. Root343]
MSAVATANQGSADISLGHLALHYGRLEDGETAARFLEAFGLRREQAFPLPTGGTFYHFIVDPAVSGLGDGIVYLSASPPAQRALVEAIHEALKVGQEGEHPAVAAFQQGQGQDPEYTFHVGMLFRSLEQVEDTIARLRDLEKSDPAFAGRLKVTLNRAQPGVAEIDARMDASPVFADVTRHPYGRHAIQAFVESDLFTAGPLGGPLVLEMDYVFPGHPDHLFAKVVL